MRTTVFKDERLEWEGTFTCPSCEGTGDDDECSNCEGDGSVVRACELRFNIVPGEPETGIGGPPENADPGCGPEVQLITAWIGEVDMTASLLDIEDAEDFISETWSVPDPDFPDTPEE